MKIDLNISDKLFGILPDGREAHIFTLSNKNGVQISITNFGGIIQSILLPDRKNAWVDIVAGYDTLEEYVADEAYFGATVGRFANRIANSSFKLNDERIKLAKNAKNHHLHGGKEGFNKKLWSAKPIVTENDCRLELSYTSPDGEENYPGNLVVLAIFSLNNLNEFSIQYFAKTDKETHINLTNHSYFNLNGSGNIAQTGVAIFAKKYTETDDELIPTGKLKTVEATALDFRKEKPIGQDIAETGVGYDHNYVLNKRGKEISFAAKASSPNSRRSIEVYTSQPGMQFYTGNFLKGIKGKNGRLYKNHDAFCFETQHYPDSPNRPEFPSTLLKPGELYEETTIYRFLY
ncbi:MAG TPA: aldose epimerase family protein [Bacteroidales bacterium]